MKLDPRTREKAKRYSALPPVMDNEERLSAWEVIRGMWKGRKPDPIKQLAAMRREWQR